MPKRSKRCREGKKSAKQNQQSEAEKREEALTERKKRIKAFNREFERMRKMKKKCYWKHGINEKKQVSHTRPVQDVSYYGKNATSGGIPQRYTTMVDYRWILKSAPLPHQRSSTSHAPMTLSSTAPRTMKGSMNGWKARKMKLPVQMRMRTTMMIRTINSYH